MDQGSRGNRIDSPARNPETEERLGNALTAVLGSFAASSALAARVHRSGARAAAFRNAAWHAARRQQAMAAHAEELRQKLDADINEADRFIQVEPPDPAVLPRHGSKEHHEGMISVAIPGLKRDIGLGDAITKLTAAVGLNHCEGCTRRAAALNRALTFRAGHPKE